MPSIDTAFIKEYEANVKEAYQRQGSMLRGTVRTRPTVVGADITFQKVGKGTASTKSRNGVVPTMGIAHTTVNCVLADSYAADWVDKLDLLKTNIDEKMAIANAGAWALGRKTDDLILTAMASPTTTIVHGSAGMTLAKAAQIVQKMTELDVPDDGSRFAVLAPKAYMDLMQLAQFSSADYTGDSAPLKGNPSRVRQWMGITWIMHSAIVVATSTYTNYAWHSSAVGHAIGAEVESDITWHGDRASWFINNMMSQGACQIDAGGIVAFETQ